MTTEAQRQVEEILTRFSNLKSNPRLTNNQIISAAIVCVEAEIKFIEHIMNAMNGYTIALTAIILTKKEVVEILKLKLKS